MDECIVGCKLVSLDDVVVVVLFLIVIIVWELLFDCLCIVEGDGEG